MQVTALVLCGAVLCFATTSADAPLLCLPTTDLTTSSHLHALTESGGIRKWVSRTMGTYQPPKIAALSVLRFRGGPHLLAVLYDDGTLSVWLPARGAVRPLCQAAVGVPDGTTAATAATTLTGMCALLTHCNPAVDAALLSHIHTSKGKIAGRHASTRGTVAASCCLCKLTRAPACTVLPAPGTPSLFQHPLTAAAPAPRASSVRWTPWQ